MSYLSQYARVSPATMLYFTYDWHLVHYCIIYNIYFSVRLQNHVSVETALVVSVQPATMPAVEIKEICDITFYTPTKELYGSHVSAF